MARIMARIPAAIDGSCRPKRMTVKGLVTVAKTLTVQDIADHIGGTVVGDGTITITGAATLSEAGSGDVSFLSLPIRPKYEQELQSSTASAVIVGPDYDDPAHCLIRTKDPYYGFMQTVVLLHGYREHEKVGVSDRASVHPTAVIGANVDIHDFVHISAEAVIGDNTRIYPNTTIGPGTRIGADCLIYPNVVVYDGCAIGDRVTIHSGTIIGQDGFGYATHNGEHHKIPQIGGVVIEDDVEIGANCAIDRGTLGDTVIGRGSKFSNLIAIGHNTQVGPYSLLVAQVGIAGSVVTGKYGVFGGQVGVVGHIQIGDFVKVGAQAGVQNNIEDNQTVLGSPAIPINQAKRSLIALKDLPELRKKVRDLEKKLRELEQLADEVDHSK